MNDRKAFDRVASLLWRTLLFLLRLTFVVVRWPLMVVLIFLIAALLIDFGGSLLVPLTPGSLERELAEVGVRLVLGLPLAAIAVLLLHPVRGPLMLGSLPYRLLRALFRRRRVAPDAALPAATGVPAEGVPAPAAVETPRPLYQPLSRRRFLIESAALTAVMADALLIEPGFVQFTTTKIPVANLPERFRGFRVAQLSDLHMSPFTTVADLARIIPQVNALNADMIVLTGDFVDRDWRYADPLVEVLRDLRAPEGVYSVLGNHDHYSGVEQVASSLSGADLGLLVNTHTVLRRGADKLYLLGVDDATPSRRYANGRPFADLPRALQGVSRDAPSLLLLHNPILAPAVVEAGIDVTLCGHTHAGQFRVPYLTDAIVRNVEYIDFGRYEWGNSQFYVNRGFGTVGPPLRFRARPEVSLIELVPA